jgi:GT2 family glycosyltransferase
MTVTGPSVHILVVNWNGRHHLEAGLPSLLDTTYQGCQVIVLDNGSTDGSQAWLHASFPQVHLVALGRNRGFAAANNAGMALALSAGADFVALLNNDTRVEPDWLAALVDAAEADPAAAICQARQRTWDGSHEIRFRFIPEWAEAAQARVPVERPGAPSLTPFASGCAMLIRCSALRRIGLFDERYFNYVEDVDLTLRAWIAGYRVLDVPQAIVYHRMTGSNSHAKQRMFWGYRNQLTTLFKLYQPETLRRFAGPISRRWFRTRNRVALRGTLAALAMLPRTLAQRRAVQQGRRQPDSEFLQLCAP